MYIQEQEYFIDAYDSNWVAPLGPCVDAFEQEMVNYLGHIQEFCALSSGSAALHLSLRVLGLTHDYLKIFTIIFAASLM